MKYWTAQDWQAILFALLAGMEAGALWLLVGGFRGHVKPWLAVCLDAALGLSVGALLLRALWQATEGLFRLYVPALMGAGFLIFRLGPGTFMRSLGYRLRKALKCGTIFPHFRGRLSWPQEAKNKDDC